MSSNKLKFSSLKRTLRLYKFIKPYQLEFYIGLFFLLCTSTASLAFPKLLGQLVDYGNTKKSIEDINQVIFLLIGVLVFQAVFAFLRTVLFTRVTEKSLKALRKYTYNHIIKLPMSFFLEKRVGELISRISSDISLLQETLTTTLASFLRQVFVITGGIILLLSTSYKLTLFMLLILPVVVFLTIFFGRFIRKYSKNVQSLVADSNIIVEETLQGIQSVKSFANEKYEKQRYLKYITKAAKTAIIGGIFRGSFHSFTILAIFGTMVAVIWKGTILITKEQMLAGELFSFVLYTGFIAGMMGGLAEVYAQIQKSVGATENLLDILDEKTEEISDDVTQENIKMLDGTIEFKNISFHYPNRRDTDVLNNISFRIEKEQQVALVGPSGAGKSTIVALLLRLYEPKSGQILFNNINAKQFSFKELRTQIAVVPQDVFLFGGSIAENIAYGNTDADFEEIISAAKKANAWEFIENLPKKLETKVGERGMQLSGGQRQRIAIARAVLRNPGILILDEATSSLDSESERLVQEALSNLMKGRTSIVIAHRLSTIRQADNIIVLDKGKVVEMGTHDYLIKNENGLYKKLNALQFNT